MFKLYIKAAYNIALTDGEIPLFALYIALSKLSHEGCIHNYNSSKVRHRLCEQIQISDSQFRKLINQLNKRGLIWIDDTRNGKELRILSQRKINQIYKNLSNDSKQMRSRFPIHSKTFKDIKLELRLFVIECKAKAMQHNENKQSNEGSLRNNYAVTIKHKQRAKTNLSLLLSRNTIRRTLGRKSLHSATYWSKKFKDAGYITEEAITLKCKDYPKLFKGIDFSSITELSYKGFFMRNGELHKRIPNLVTFNRVEGKYFFNTSTRKMELRWTNKDVSAFLKVMKNAIENSKINKKELIAKVEPRINSTKNRHDQ